MAQVAGVGPVIRDGVLGQRSVLFPDCAPVRRFSRKADLVKSCTSQHLLYLSPRESQFKACAKRVIGIGGHHIEASMAMEFDGPLCHQESRIRGRSAEERRAIRQAETKPLVEKLKAWLETRTGLVAVSERSTIATVIRYGLSRWDGLVHFLDDGRIEMDKNSVERPMRPITLNRKNCLFAGTMKVPLTGHVLHR
jgi:hypothetical protein